MKDVVRLVAVILVCQLPPVPKTAPARDFGRKHQRINGGEDDDNDADHHADNNDNDDHNDCSEKTPVRDFSRKEQEN